MIPDFQRNLKRSFHDACPAHSASVHKMIQCLNLVLSKESELPRHSDKMTADKSLRASFRQGRSPNEQISQEIFS
jgi:hypothetical protein